MTLHSPTDDQLNAAFAEKVAGWNFIPDGNGVKWFVPPDLPPAANLRVNRPIPRFTQSMDVVLPWLEKGDANCACYEFEGVRTWNTSIRNTGADDVSLPRACVIALLRANGVEVNL
jgi:hypothetical protein